MIDESLAAIEKQALRNRDLQTKEASVYVTAAGLLMGAFGILLIMAHKFASNLPCAGAFEKVATWFLMVALCVGALLTVASIGMSFYAWRYPSAVRAWAFHQSWHYTRDHEHWPFMPDIRWDIVKNLLYFEEQTYAILYRVRKMQIYGCILLVLCIVAISAISLV